MDNYSILDLEFFNLYGNIVLISGSILQNNSITKFEGRPLIISHNNVTTITDHQINKLKNILQKSLTKKPDTLKAIQDQLQLSIQTKDSNLTQKHIKNHITKSENIFFWNGQYDKKILNRLNVLNHKIFDINAYDILNNKIFSLHIKDTQTNNIIMSYNLGYINKNGRMLSLNEAHNAIKCTNTHNINYLHDPTTDVILTNCLLTFLLKKKK